MAEIIQKTQKKTIYREGKTLVKLFNNEYPKSDVLNEALNTARVEESTTLNVPAVHEVTKVNGEWAIIQAFVEGKTMQQLMEENPDKTGELLNEFVDLQVEVLSQKVPLLSPLKDKMHRKISRIFRLRHQRKYAIDQGCQTREKRRQVRVDRFSVRRREQRRRDLLL